jgi:hypothetical protein
VLDDGKNEMLRAVVPIFIDFFAEIKFACFRIDHGMVDFANEDNFGGSPRKLLKSHLELQLRIFVQSVADEQYPVPDCINGRLLSRVSS